MNTDILIPMAVDMLVKSTGILLFAFAVQCLWRSASAAQRCLVWGAAFTLLVLLPLTLLITPPWPLVMARQEATTPLHASTVQIEERGSLTPQSMVESMAQRPRSPRISATEGILGSWIVGAALLLGWRLVGAWQVRRLHRQSAPMGDSRAAELMAKIVQDLGIVRRIDLREFSDVSVSLTWGVFTPVLLLPRDARLWNDASLAAALTHELGHIQHRDAATRLLMNLVCAVFWPHALVWLAAKAWRAAQEQACDDLVLRSGAAAQDYAKQLLDAARGMSGNGFAFGPAMAMVRPSTLERRLCAIMDDTRDRRSLHSRAWLAGGGCVALLFTMCAALQVRAQDHRKPGPDAAKDAGQAIPVILQVRILEAPWGASPPPFDAPSLKTVDGVKGVMTPRQAEAWLKQAEAVKGMTLLSSPTVTTRSGQSAVIESGQNSGTDRFEGIRIEATPELRIDHKFIDLNLVFTLRLKASPAAAGGKAGFKVLRLATQVTMYTGATLVLSETNPVDEKRQVVVLVTAGMVNDEGKKGAKPPARRKTDEAPQDGSAARVPSNASNDSKDSVYLLDKGDGVRAERRDYKDGEVPGLLTQRYAENPKLKVLVMSDGAMSMERMQQLLSMVRTAGLTDLSFVALRPDQLQNFDRIK